MSRLVKLDTGITSEEAFIRAIKTVLGVDISLSDLERAKAEAEELDPEELEAAAGGGKGGSDIENFNWCMADYACFAAVKHDTNSGSHEEVCWKDYICSFIYHDGIFACTAADKFKRAVLYRITSNNQRKGRVYPIGSKHRKTSLRKAARNRCCSPEAFLPFG